MSLQTNQDNACLHQLQAMLAPEQTFAHQGFLETDHWIKDAKAATTWCQAQNRSNHIVASRDPFNLLVGAELQSSMSLLKEMSARGN